MDNIDNIVDKYKALKYKIKLANKMSVKPTRGSNAVKSDKNSPTYKQEIVNKYRTLKYKHKLETVQ